MGQNTNGETTTIMNQITPVISINKHGYQRTTIQAKASLYPLNTKIDKSSHDHLKAIKAYYNKLTGLKVRDSVIMRRAIESLGEHVSTADPRIEQAAIVRVANRNSPERSSL